MYSEETIQKVKSSAVTHEVIAQHLHLNKKGDNWEACCPFHNEKSPSFLVSEKKNIYKCFGCGVSGDAIQFLKEYSGTKMNFIQAIEYLAKMYNITLIKSDMEPSKKYNLPQWKNNTELSPNVVKWFEDRGIEQKTIVDFKITQGLEWMPQVQKEVNTIQFNYFRDSKLVNVKYRDKNKNFKLHSGAELVLYNIDSLKGKKEAWIVEGEPDCMTLAQCGYVNEYSGVVSVPNGAGKNKNNLQYIDSSIDLFDSIEKIHIAVDDDLPGRKLREELSLRFGKDRCDYVEWNGKKDANDVLKEQGMQAVINCCSMRKEFPLEGVFSISDFSNSIDDMYVNGLPKGSSCGIVDFDLSFVRGYITGITGIPSHGKTTFLDEICLKLLVNAGWKGAFYSPENKPTELHFAKMARRLVGKHWDGPNRMTINEKDRVKKFLEGKIWFIKPEKDFSLMSILNTIRDLQKRHGLDYFVIDAWNKLDTKETDTDSIGKSLDTLANFCELNQLHCFLVVHPTKMPKDKQTGKYEVPTLYNLNGSSNFYNKLDNGICVYRDFETETVRIYRQKIKFDHWGTFGFSEYKYDPASMRYYVEGFPDNYNWINNQPIQEEIYYDATPKIQPNQNFLNVEGVILDNGEEIPF